jgi:membrane-associated HD superfamily phosphohydrolase
MCAGGNIKGIVVLIVGIALIILFTASEFKKEKGKRRILKMILIDVVIAVLTLSLFGSVFFTWC